MGKETGQEFAVAVTAATVGGGVMLPDGDPRKLLI
jgi:hypothetical protein